MMELNYTVTGLIILFVIVVVIILIRRNKKDQKKLENKLNRSELQAEEHPEEKV